MVTALCTFPSNSLGTMLGYLLETGRPVTLIFESDPPKVNFPAPDTRSKELKTALAGASAQVEVYTAAPESLQNQIAAHEGVSVTDLRTTPREFLITDELVAMPAHELDDSDTAPMNRSISVLENPYRRDTYLEKEYGIN